MNNKINISSLVAMLALKSGLTKEKSEEFIKEFFSIISETLKEGESVKIRALGTFKIINMEKRKSVNVTNGEEIVIPEHKRIVFVPSKEMAEVVNAPFSMFDSVEIHPDAEKELEDIPEVETVVEAEATAEAPDETVNEVGVVKVENSVETSTEPISEPASVEEESEAVSEEETKLYEPEEMKEAREKGGEEPTIDTAQAPEAEIVETSTPEENAPDETEETEFVGSTASSDKGKGGMKFVMGFISGLVVALILVGVSYWYFIYRNASTEQAAPAKQAALSEVVVPEVDTIVSEIEEDSVGVPKPLNEAEASMAESELPPTQPSDPEPKVIKDVIGPHNYLTTMAQRHYGDFNLWAYIYEENKSFLGHPDRIKPGTEVVVPPLSKYGVDPKNPQDILKAKRLGIEIYNRFK